MRVSSVGVVLQTVLAMQYGYYCTAFHTASLDHSAKDHHSACLIVGLIVDLTEAG